MRFVCASALVFACGCGASQPERVEAPAGPAAKTYAVHLFRPSRVGERAHVVMEDDERNETTISQGTQVVDQKHEETAIHFVADETVGAVDETGRPTRSHWDVQELVVDGRTLARGPIDIKNAPKAENATILVGGAPAAEEVRKALGSLLKLGLGGATDDEVFGTKVPQPVGGRWAVDGELARADLKEENDIDARSVTGEAWLQGLDRVNDVECLDVRMKLAVELSGIASLPEGATMESGVAEAEGAACLPLDGRVERVSDHLSMTMTVKLRVNGPAGPLSLVVRSIQKREAHYAPI